MSKELILEDWSEYDNRKLKKVDRLFFSCEEKWEVDYLIKKIKKVYPHLDVNDIAFSISACCKIVDAPRPREAFINCVITSLSFKGLL